MSLDVSSELELPDPLIAESPLHVPGLSGVRECHQSCQSQHSIKIQPSMGEGSEMVLACW